MVGNIEAGKRGGGGDFRGGGMWGESRSLSLIWNVLDLKYFCQVYHVARFQEVPFS